MKRYFKLNYDEIVKIMFSSNEKSATKEAEKQTSRETKISGHGSEISATNKEFNINNLNKELKDKELKDKELKDKELKKPDDSINKPR